MDQGINNILLEELFEAHGAFENIIAEMKEKEISYPYDKVISMEKCSYNLCYNSITKMNDAQERYNLLRDENKEFFSGERRVIIKYLALYVVSIIMIKVFAKTLSAEKINEIWYALLGMTLGTVNAGIISKNINAYRNNTRESREFVSNLHELKDTYDENFEIARREVSYIFSLNRNLEAEIPEEKIFQKNKMQ